jgi:tetratricopeptide (TPR) repeat protein
METGSFIFRLILLSALSVCARSRESSSWFPPPSSAFTEKTSPALATLRISQFPATLNSPLGSGLEAMMPFAIRAAAQSVQFQWLRIAEDSAVPKNGSLYTIQGSIQDFQSYLMLNLELVSLGKKKQSCFSKSFRLSADSLLVEADLASREALNAIFDDLVFTKTSDFKLFTLPFTDETGKAGKGSIGEYLGSQVAAYLDEKGSPWKVQPSQTQIKKMDKFTSVILDGTFARGDTLRVSASLSDALEKTPFYRIDAQLPTKDVFELPKSMANEIKQALIAYKDVRKGLSEQKSTKLLCEKGDSYLRDSTKSNGVWKSKLFYFRALSLDSNCLNALQGLGDAFLAQLEYHKALENYGKAAKIDSSSPAAMLGMGKAWDALNDSAKAIECYRRSLQRAQAGGDRLGESMALWSIGKMKSERGDYDSGLVYLRKSLALDSLNPQTWYFIGFSHFMKYSTAANKINDTSDAAAALEIFKKAESIFPDSSFHFNWCKVMNDWGISIVRKWFLLDSMGASQLGRRAAEKFRRSDEAIPGEPNLSASNLSYLAYISSTYHEKKKAMEYSRKAKAFHPNDEWTYRLFASLHKDEKGYQEEALQSIRTALEIEKTTESLEILGDIFAAKNMPDSAFGAYLEALKFGKSISSSAMAGLFNSALQSPAMQSEAAAFFQVKAENNPGVRTYVDYLSALYRKVKKGKPIPALEKYLAAKVKKADSLWAYQTLAEMATIDSAYAEATEYLDEALKFHVFEGIAPDELEPLFLNYAPAFEMASKSLMDYGKKTKAASVYACLARVRIMRRDFGRAQEAAQLSARISTTRGDSCDAFYLQGTILFKLGKISDEKGDSGSAKKSFLEATRLFEKADSLTSNWSSPLATLNLIYHDYLIDFEKSYQACLREVSLEPENIGYRENLVEAELTSGRFSDAIKSASKLLNPDSLTGLRLAEGRTKVMRFILVAALIGSGNSWGAHTEFGSLKNDFQASTDSIEGWSWKGTKDFLCNTAAIKPAYQDILLKIIQAMETGGKKGRASLDEADSDWGKLVLATTKKLEED